MSSSEEYLDSLLDSILGGGKSDEEEKTAFGMESGDNQTVPADGGKAMSPQEIEEMLRPALDGFDLGLMSEAGVPAVADPGAELVAAAHRKGIKVVPLVGASSIIMSLMASGLTGQTFTFNGYLPVKDDARRTAIARMERTALADGYSQIFIEAPYRNDKLLDNLLKILSPAIRLTVACDITSGQEYIRTDTVAGWRKTNIPTLHKRPTIFIIGR